MCIIRYYVHCFYFSASVAFVLVLNHKRILFPVEHHKNSMNCMCMGKQAYPISFSSVVYRWCQQSLNHHMTLIAQFGELFIRVRNSVYSRISSLEGNHECRGWPLKSLLYWVVQAQLELKKQKKKKKKKSITTVMNAEW